MAEHDTEAENDYMLGMKYKDIAAKYGVTINTVKSWKQRYGWERCGDSGRKSSKKNANTQTEKSVHTKPEKVCTQRKKGAHTEEQYEEPAAPDDGLTEKQRLFCLYYIKYRNKVKAYQKAYKCPYINACGNASNLFKKIEVQREINRIMAEIRQDIRIDIMDLIQQQIDIARADITDFIEIDDGIVRVKTDIDGTIIKEIRDTQTGISIKLYDKQKAIDFLKDNLPDGAGERQADQMQALAEIILNSRPNRNLTDYE